MRCGKVIDLGGTPQGDRYSINAVAWHGPSLASHRPGVLPHDLSASGDEELDLTVTIPVAKGMKTAWFGRTVVAHYSFRTQDAEVTAATDVLAGYEALARSVTSRDYRRNVETNFSR